MYMNAGGEKRFLPPVIRYFGKTKLKDIRQAELDAAASALYPHAAKSTRRRQLYTPAIAVLNCAAENDLYDWRKFKRPKEEDVHRDVPTAEWWEKVQPECSAHLRGLLLFLNLTGARISEACRVFPGHVDRDTRKALLGRTKNGEARVVTIPKAIWPLILELLDTCPEGKPLFRYKNKSGVYGALERACERAAVRCHTTHEIGRHSFATGLLKAGKSLVHVRKAGGWKSSRLVSETYGHLEEEDYDEALEAMAAERAPKVRKVE